MYLHGDGVLYWDWKWVVGVRDELRAAGFPTFFELFPDSIDARAAYWMPFLEQRVRVTEETFSWGGRAGRWPRCGLRRSSGSAVWFLVAPYFNYPGFEVVRRAGWLNRPWDWDRVRAHAGTSPGGHLAAEMLLVPGAGHFGEEEEAFPALTAHILQTYGRR